MKKHWPLIVILLLAAVLRLFALDKYPVGLNADEAALGYNAYSLLLTGKDEHGISWPLVFRSFDDYKPPLYVYLTIPFVKLLGLNIWSVRLPSALLGIATVYFVYLLVSSLRLFSDQKKDRFLALASAFFLAVSPWHLHFSRGAWEVNVSTFLLVMGSYFFVKGLAKPRHFLVFALSFALSLYTYHSARIVAPLLMIALVLIYRRSLFAKKNLKGVLAAAILGLVLSAPIAFQLLSKEGQSRFSGVSIFADTGPLSYVLEQRRTDPHPDALLTKIKYNRYTAYAGYYLKNYVSHYSPQFLFVSGDVIDRSRVPGFGQTYSILSVFIILGSVFLIFKFRKNTGAGLILAWFLIAPAAAALTFQSPHALRSQNEVIPLSIITALGLVVLFSFLSRFKSKLLSWLIFVPFVAALIFQIKNYLTAYYFTYPRELPMAWQYGFSDIAAYTKANYAKYDKIIITDRWDQPYILIAFFQQYPPAQLQQELVMSPIDNFGFSTGRSFGKYEFRRIDPLKDLQNPHTLLVSEGKTFPEKMVIKTITSAQGDVLFEFADTSLK